MSGWQRRAWLDGDWDLAAGQFFTTFRRDVHVVSDFDETRAREWFAALDYGFAHYTVVLLGCTDGDGNVFVVDEHAERLWLPQRHGAAVKAMLERHGLAVEQLRRFVAGADVFSRQSDGTTIAQQYAREGIKLRPANMDRVNGWAELLQGFGDPAAESFDHISHDWMRQHVPVDIRVDQDSQGHKDQDHAWAIAIIRAKDNAQSRAIIVENSRWVLDSVSSVFINYLGLSYAGWRESENKALLACIHPIGGPGRCYDRSQLISEN